MLAVVAIAIAVAVAMVLGLQYRPFVGQRVRLQWVSPNQGPSAGVFGPNSVPKIKRIALKI